MALYINTSKALLNTKEGYLKSLNIYLWKTK
jgi:hypothetical protein